MPRWFRFGWAEPFPRTGCAPARGNYYKTLLAGGCRESAKSDVLSHERPCRTKSEARERAGNRRLCLPSLAYSLIQETKMQLGLAARDISYTVRSLRRTATGCCQRTFGPRTRRCRNVLVALDRYRAHVRLFPGAACAAVRMPLGFVLAYAAIRLTARYLVPLPGADPLTFVAVPLVLAVVVLLACYFPAARASREPDRSLTCVVRAHEGRKTLRACTLAGTSLSPFPQSAL